jgi:hypothetical protein
LIIDKYKLEEQFDFVLVGGTSFGEGTVIELDMNVLKIWDSNDNCGWGRKTLEELVDSLSI